MFSSHFPESMFPPSDPKIYNDLCRQGESKAEKSTVVIAGLCRNTPKFLFLKSYLCHIGSLFKDYRIVLYENDSTDDTLSNLLKWELNDHKVKIITEKLNWPPNEQDHSLGRRKRMAYYRNKLLHWTILYKTDYIIMLDTDISYSYEGILNTIGYNLDVCGSNGLFYRNENGPQRLYFDSWAYRDIGKEYDSKTNLLYLNRGEDPYEVDSCFGGMAIYKSNVLDKVFYTEKDCDHVTLHEQIRNNGYKVWLNPSQITLYTEHYYQL